MPFLTQFGVTAGYQISWAIYVSDYSRYLPPDVTVRKTFWWTYWGSGLGAAWLMGLGALLASSAGDAFDTVKSIDSAGERDLRRLRHDRAALRGARPDLGDGAEPLRRIADR